MRLQAEAMTLASICRPILAILFLIAMAVGASGQALDTRCMQAGGDAFCRDPIPLPLTPTPRSIRDMWHLRRLRSGRLVHMARAGVVHGDGGGCGKPVFDTTLVSVSTEFERIVNKACEVNFIDSGWGQTLPSNILCWTGPPLSKSGILVRDFRILNFTGLAPTATGCNATWKDTVYAGRWRDAGCPPGFTHARARTATPSAGRSFQPV